MDCLYKQIEELRADMKLVLHENCQLKNQVAEAEVSMLYHLKIRIRPR